jgi:hypothetical protein
LDGAEIACEKSAFTLTFKVGNSSKSVKVSLKDPKYTAKTDANGNYVDANGNPVDKAEDAEQIIKVTSYQLEATDANQTVAKAADGTTITLRLITSH